MAKDHQNLLIILLLTTCNLVTSYCPSDKVHSVGMCSFRIKCLGAIRDIKLPENCQGSPNYPVKIDVIITDAVERFDDNFVDTDYLENIVTLRITADWRETSLALLDYMQNLENIYLTGNQIEVITGKPFYNLDSLEYIDMSHNKLKTLSNIFTFKNSPNKLKRLSLANNAIAELSYDVFDELTSLEELDLSHNLLTDLTDEPFSNLTSLKILRLNYNRIRNLNGAVNYLKNLKHLYLRGNELQNVDDESLTIIHHLETFDISKNGLDILRPNIFLRHWLHFEEKFVCRIILSDNHIAFVPNATSKEMIIRFTRNLPKTSNVDVLTEVDLSKNHISSIEYNAFQAILRLTYLDLSRNNLSHFNINPQDLEQLRYLNLSGNQISNLYYESFAPLVMLKTLDLSYNKLEYIPDQTFSNNYNLNYVNLTNNYFKGLIELRFPIFNPEGFIDLSNNSISSLQIPYGEGLRLSTLVLDSNNITDAGNVRLFYQSELKTLIISKNKIKELTKNSLRLPVTLYYLDLSFNQIQSISPSVFRRCGHLQKLRLLGNNLTSIAYGAFHGLKELKILDLSFNKIKYIDGDVFMDLKHLQILSLRYNSIHKLDYKVWFGHGGLLKVYLDGNKLSCEWLGTALRDYDRGYSKMRPLVVTETEVGHSLGGVPCEPDLASEALVDFATMRKSNMISMDERLLITSRKILTAIEDQTYYLKKFLYSISNQNQKVRP